MVDSRIYRAMLGLVAVAVIVFAFSLGDQPAAAPSNLAPSALAGKPPLATMSELGRLFPHRRPGSAGDRALAGYVASQLGAIHGYTVARATTESNTAQGEQSITTVTATRPGLAPGALVVLSHRDGPGAAGLSGTAVFLDLARLLAGETENHTLVLVSTSGAVGQAGAIQVAGMLSGQPVDAVMVLGDLAAAHPSQPIVSPWSNGEVVAPMLLRQTLGRYVTAQTGLSPGNVNLAAQFAHLAFPLTITGQGPFGDLGVPAVLLSLSGYRLPVAGEPISPAHMQGAENALLQALNALDNAPRVPPPSAYLVLSGKVVPGWAVSLLVIALILPVSAATLDALARVRRRGHSILRWIGWVLASAIPFLICFAVLLVVRFGHLLPATPPGPQAGGVALTAPGIVLLVVLIALLAGGFALVRPGAVRAAARLGDTVQMHGRPAGDAAAVALMVVLCLTALAIWVANPFAAALLVPALHLWLWLAQPSTRRRRSVMVALALAGLAPGLLLLAYYAHSLGLSPVGIAWTGVLLVAGGQLSVAAGVVLCVLLGCAVSVFVIAFRAITPTTSQADVKVTVRGPVTYAGPGSLGGTKSALGSRR